MNRLMHFLTRFLPATENGRYDRDALWDNPRPYLVPNVLAAAFWGAVGFGLCAHTGLPRDVFLAIAWLHCSIAIACLAVPVLTMLGVGPEGPARHKPPRNG